MTPNTIDVSVMQQTEHPHIVQGAGVCGRRPIVKGCYKPRSRLSAASI